MRAVVTIACTIAVGLAVPARGARAEGPKATDSDARADELFRDGVQKFDAGQVNEACDSFTESLRLDPKLGTLLNLALCHENQGKLAAAWTEYSHGAAWAMQQGQKDRREFANQHALSLEARLSRVLLKLPAGQNLARVEIDREPVPASRWFLPIYLNPGEHAVTVSTDKRSETILFVLPEGPSAQTIALPALEGAGAVAWQPGTAPTPASDAGFSTRQKIGLATVGVGVVGLAVGTIFGFRTLSQRDDIGSHCVGNACDAAGLAAHDAARSSATVSTIGFAAGLVGVGVGTWLYLSAPKHVMRNAQLAPVVTPSFGGLSMQAAW